LLAKQQPHKTSAYYLTFMNTNWLLHNFVTRNLLGLAALLLVHYLADLYSIGARLGFNKLSPYLYLLLLYGWLVFHNHILFEQRFLRGKKATYFGWLFLIMGLGSFNINFILRTQFNVTHTLPQVVSFWVYTITGLGVYVTYRYLSNLTEKPSSSESPDNQENGFFSFMADGQTHNLLYADIQYVESLENYVKVITKAKTFVARQTLKEVEGRLPKQQFVRISRSHIINMAQAKRVGMDEINVAGKELRIGKVYKRHVAERL
jgi:LytTr DNA-binding domain